MPIRIKENEMPGWQILSGLIAILGGITSDDVPWWSCIIGIFLIAVGFIGMNNHITKK